MYVRWKRQPLRKRRWGEPAPRVSLRALLVAAERRDGAPRQRILAYLGAIEQRLIAYPWCRDYFWKHADARLDALHLAPADRTRIEAALAVQVPRPTEADRAAGRAEIAATEQRIAASLGR